MISELRIPCSRFLDENGDAVAPLPPCAQNQAELIRMYRMMVLTRAFDSKAINLQRVGQLHTYPPALGHEAVQVASAAALLETDCIAPVYREIGAQLWRGVRMSEILLYWSGDERGNNFSGPRHDFPNCVAIATQTLHAAGAAMAFKIRGEPRCALAFIGDGGTSEGAFYEAINLAGVDKLPVVFLIVNNQWAISTPVRMQTASPTLAHKAIAAGIPGIQIDGNDFLAVRDSVGNALDHARTGKGSTVIEAITYRLGDHTTADDARRYRTEDEVTKAWMREPIKRARNYLTRIGLWDEAQEQALQAECALQIDTAVREFMGIPGQSTDAMFDYLFATLPRHLVAQKKSARRYAPGSTDMES